MQAIESRLKLMYGTNTPEISMQFLLNCNYLNEGCEGGWPILNGYLAENGYLVSEKCAPYLGTTKGAKCSHYEKCPPVAGIKQSYFLGGGFGEYQTSVQIQKEILRNGPVIANMKTPKYFKYYKMGTLKNDDNNLMIEQKMAEIWECEECID